MDFLVPPQVQIILRIWDYTAPPLLQNQYVSEILLHPVTKYFHVHDLKMSFNCYIQINNIIFRTIFNAVLKHTL